MVLVNVLFARSSSARVIKKDRTVVNRFDLDITRGPEEPRPRSGHEERLPNKVCTSSLKNNLSVYITAESNAVGNNAKTRKAGLALKGAWHLLS
jgi:hypothetical protein